MMMVSILKNQSAPLYIRILKKQQVEKKESDGIYDDYFGQKAEQIDEYMEGDVFTDVDEYYGGVEQDSLKPGEEGDYFDDKSNDYLGYGSWGENASDVNINVYGGGYNYGLGWIWYWPLVGAGAAGMVPVGAGEAGMVPVGAGEAGMVPDGAGEAGMVLVGAGAAGTAILITATATDMDMDMDMEGMDITEAEEAITDQIPLLVMHIVEGPIQAFYSRPKHSHKS